MLRGAGVEDALSTPGPPSRGPDDVPSAEELQRAIASVTGVTAAEVTRATNGRDRLRISLAPGEDPEAVAWSVAATLRERFGIALDPAAISARAIADPSDDPVRVISRVEPTRAAGEDAPVPPPPAPDQPTPGAAPGRPVAPQAADPAPRGRAETEGPVAAPAEPPPSGQYASPDLVAAARAALAADASETADAPGPAATAEAPTRAATADDASRNRAAISELCAHPVGDEFDVTASLRLSGHEVTGRARGVRTRRGRWRAISEATIDALAALSADRVRGHVDHVTVLTFADLAHVSVSVTLLTDRGEETFVGAALVRDDPDRAVMRATLDAVNRRVEPWLAAATADMPATG